MRGDSSSASLRALRSLRQSCRRIRARAAPEVARCSSRNPRRPSSTRCRSVRTLCGIRLRMFSRLRPERVDDVDGRVEGQLPGQDALERLDHAVERPPARQGGVAIAAAAHLQLLGQGQFLVAVQQRDGAHLAQVQAQRIVRGVRILALLIDLARRHVVEGGRQGLGRFLGGFFVRLGLVAFLLGLPALPLFFQIDLGGIDVQERLGRWGPFGPLGGSSRGHGIRPVGVVRLLAVNGVPSFAHAEWPTWNNAACRGRPTPCLSGLSLPPRPLQRGKQYRRRFLPVRPSE